MFDRVGIKSRAKESLAGNYWVAFAVSLLVGMVAGGDSSFNFNFNFDLGVAEDAVLYGNPFSDFFGEIFSSPFWGVLLGVAMFGVLFGIAASIAITYFVTGPAAVGGARYFTNLCKEDAKFTDIFFAFNSKIQGAYMNVCKVMFFRFLYLMLWSLVVLIPAFFVMLGAVLSAVGGLSEFLGVMLILLGLILLIPALIPVTIKGLEYSLIPYLLAEYPKMSRKEAFAATKELTAGHKGDLFVLRLSFLGWMLLGALCCGVGTLFVAPYVEASMAQAYAHLCALHNPPQDTPAPTPVAPTPSAPTAEEPAPVSEEPASVSEEPAAPVTDVSDDTDQ